MNNWLVEYYIRNHHLPCHPSLNLLSGVDITFIYNHPSLPHFLSLFNGESSGAALPIGFKTSLNPLERSSAGKYTRCLPFGHLGVTAPVVATLEIGIEYLNPLKVTL